MFQLWSFSLFFLKMIKARKSPLLHLGWWAVWSRPLSVSLSRTLTLNPSSRWTILARTPPPVTLRCLHKAGVDTSVDVLLAIRFMCVSAAWDLRCFQCFDKKPACCARRIICSARRCLLLLLWSVICDHNFNLSWYETRVVVITEVLHCCCSVLFNSLVSVCLWWVYYVVNSVIRNTELNKECNKSLR